MSIPGQTWKCARMIAVMASLAAITAVGVVAFSTGPPASHTGAPGEGLCTNCHASFPPNSGPGILTLIVPPAYEFGATYQVTVRLEQTGQQRWGFQITALTPTNQMAGSWTITDPLRTQTVSGLGRSYVEHTSQGTFAGTPNGPVEWQMNWQAPSSNVGAVTFYAAGNAANNNGTALGDYIYSTSSAVPPAPSAVMVTAPNGGETWGIGSVQTITWSTTNVTGSVKIELSRNGGASFPEVLFASTPNDGTENWTVTGPATSQARIRISSVSNPSAADTSDANFSIVQPMITVLAPNAGETWSIGTVQTIQWNSSFVTGNVKIELSRDGGASFPEVLFANTANDGTENWTVLGPATSAARVRISSVSSASVSDTSDADFSIVEGPIVVAVAIDPGWNMISNPITTGNDSVWQLFPTAAFPYAFGFSSSTGYFQSFRMFNGFGYWEKFASETTQVISGLPRTIDSIDVMMGWNMIGSISCTVNVAGIVTVPPLILASSWYGFLNVGGYFVASQIVPGKGYWVKVSEAGRIVLACGSSKASASPWTGLESFSTFTFADQSGGSQTLYLGPADALTLPIEMYEMPPQGPAGTFDARFLSQRMVEVYSAESTEAEYPLVIHSTSYPVRMRWNIQEDRERVFMLCDGVTGNILPPRYISGTGQIVIENPAVQRLVISTKVVGLPMEFALEQNYPNPFNPTTTIRFALPVESKVNAEVYNILGQRVATLVNEVLPAGYHTMEWNGTSSAGQALGSGVYFVRLSAIGGGKRFNDVKKLALVK